MGSHRHDRVLVLWLPGLLAALGHRRQVLRVVDHAVDFHSVRVEAARDVRDVAVADGRHEHQPVLVGQVDPDAGPNDLVDQGPLPDAVDGIPTRVCDGAVEVVGVALSPVASRVVEQGDGVQVLARASSRPEASSPPGTAPPRHRICRNRRRRNPGPASARPRRHWRTSRGSSCCRHGSCGCWRYRCCRARDHGRRRARPRSARPSPTRRSWCTPCCTQGPRRSRTGRWRHHKSDLRGMWSAIGGLP